MKKRKIQYRYLDGGITMVDGFQAAGYSAGIKKAGNLDLALIFSETPCTVAALFTKNRLPAAPLLLNKQHLKKNGKGQAVIINSGNANAFTGTQGKRDAETMARETARHLFIEKTAVYVASTGVIGQNLPIERITEGLPTLVSSLSKDGGLEAAEAIRTTDTYPKETAVEGRVGKNNIRIGGISKGCGMIHPNMATMLAFLSSDISMAPHLLQAALKEAVKVSFNRITVDGETSTNDMILLFANGKKGGVIHTKGTRFRQFVDILTQACSLLAKMLVRDAEGGTKFIEICVTRTRDQRSAELICAAIAGSILVKTAFFGEDANWGRIIAAIGNAGIRVKPEEIDLSFGTIKLVKKGIYLGKRVESEVNSYLKGKKLLLTISLDSGLCSARRWTSDLSLDYIKINAFYRS